MADMDEFGENIMGESVDPAAEFLAREQSELAGLDDEENFGDVLPDNRHAHDEYEQPSYEFQSNGPSSMYEPISQQDTVRVVPEKILIWQQEQRTRLEKKDAEEEKKQKELKEKAKKELDDWYKHHAEQLEKARSNNRITEKAFIKDRDETVPGQAWEKITRLCEFNPKHSKCTKDMTRLRSVLLQLKQAPLVR